MYAVNPLEEPIHERQAGESDRDWQAFSVYLACRSYVRTCAALGLTATQARELSGKWAWRARTAAYDRFVSEHAGEVIRAVTSSILEKRVGLWDEAWSLIWSELRKHAARAAKTPDLPALELKEIAALLRVAERAAQHLAGPLESKEADANTGAPSTRAEWNLEKLAPDDLLALARLRSKAAG